MIEGPGRPSSYDPPRHPVRGESLEWRYRYAGLMSDRDILPHLVQRNRDQRIRVGSFDSDEPSTWTTASRHGVSLRIPPHAIAGETITLDAYRSWDASQTNTTTKGTAA